MFEATLPTMPRLLTALAEWMSCAVILLHMERRWTRKATAVWHLLFGAVIVWANYLAFEAADHAGDNGWNGYNVWIIGVIICVLILLLYMKVCSRSSFSTVTGCWAIAFVVAELLASIEWQISSILLPDRSLKEVEAVFVMAAVFAVGLTAVYLAEKRILNGFIRMEWKRSVLLVIMAALAMVISNVGFQKIAWEEQTDLRTTLSYIRTLVDFGAFVSMYLLQRMDWEHNMQLEMAAINHMLNMQYQQYRDYKANSEYISRQCHDLKHQIKALRKACTEDEREISLREMETAIQNYNAQNVTGNPVLDTMLTQKKIFCAQNGIQFSCMADARELAQIAVRDISIIFGNLIDNAIECVIQYEDEEDRIIQGEVYQKNSFLMIKFKNCFFGELQFEKDLPVTTKTDRSRHGYGLKGVLYTVKKYEGTMKIAAENGWFSVQILLPIKTEQ